MQTTETKKRKADDMIHFILSVESHLIFPQDDDFDDFDHEFNYKHFCIAGHSDDTLGDILTPERMEDMGVNGSFQLIYKGGGSWGRKAMNLSMTMPLGHLHTVCQKEKGSLEIIAKPHQSIWYECIQLTDEEIVAAKQVVNECKKRRILSPLVALKK